MVHVSCYIHIPYDCLPHRLEPIAFIFQLQEHLQVVNDNPYQLLSYHNIPDSKWNLLRNLLFSYPLRYE